VLDFFFEHHGKDIFWVDHTPFVLAMPEQYKDPENPIQSYRNYLIGAKGYAVWKHGNEPDWWDAEAHKPARERYLADQQAKKVQRANAKSNRVQGSLQNSERV
jgi:hypothetical protein